MLGRFRNAMTYALDVIVPVSPDGEYQNGSGADNRRNLAPKFPYQRPAFLRLSDDEVQASADQALRPILIPRNSLSLPWLAGYAEVVNAGKSRVNEDQASIHKITINMKNGKVITRKYGDRKMGGTRRRKSSRSRSRGGGIGSSGGSGGGSGSGSGSDFTINSSPDDLGEVQSSDGGGGGGGGGLIVEEEEAEESDGVDSLVFHYFAIFDGHAGTGAAIFAANSLHHHIKDKLKEVSPVIHNLDTNPTKYFVPPPSRRNKSSFVNTITVESLVTGALECAFHLMDSQIAVERSAFNVSGGCTCVVALFFRDKLYVANAGDSRAIIVRGGEVALSTNDFTPESERQRIQELAASQPHLLGEEFSPLQYLRRTTSKDLGEPIYYRDYNMQGWSIKIAEEEDLKPSVVAGTGRRHRIMQTIGVARGFGDFDLKVFDSDIYLKPFLSCTPEIFVYDISSSTSSLTSQSSSITSSMDDVLVMATDGLWDVLSNEAAASSLSASFASAPTSAAVRQKYTLAAQDLVMQARGSATSGPNRSWRLTDGHQASEDDISCIVIPLMAACCINEADMEQQLQQQQLMKNKRNRGGKVDQNNNNNNNNTNNSNYTNENITTNNSTTNSNNSVDNNFGGKRKEANVGHLAPEEGPSPKWPRR